MSGMRSIVRGSSGLGWLVPPARDRWIVWLADGARALLSVSPAYRGAWAIAIRSTAQDLRDRLPTPVSHTPPP